MEENFELQPRANPLSESFDDDFEYLLNTENSLEQDEGYDVNIDNYPARNDHNESETLTSGKSSVFSASFNMTKTIVGAGVFGLPSAFQKSGFFTVVFLIIVMAIFINWTLQVLLRAGLRAKAYSYHSLMNQCFGNRGFLMYGIFSFLFAFGGMAAYTVIIGDTVPIVLRSIFGLGSTPSEELSWFFKILTDRRFAIFLSSFCIILPVSSVKNISSLAKYSIFALIAIICIAFLVVISGSNIDNSLRGTDNNVFTFIKFQGLSGAIGTLCFAYVCHHNTFIIFKSLQFPTTQNFDKVNLNSLGFAMLSSLFIGISGFLIFTNKIKSNVLNCFSDQDSLINFARLLFALDMFLTYPLELFIARNTIFMFFFNGDNVSLNLHYMITFALVFSTFIIGISTCNLGMVFDLTGGVAASAIAFVFPSACTIKLEGGNVFHSSNWSHLACIAFGMAVLCITTITTFFEAMGPADTNNQCKFLNF